MVLLQQCLFNLRRLKKCGLSPKTLTDFYRCTNAVSPPGMAIAPPTTAGLSRSWGALPALQDIYSTRCHRKAKKIIKDLSHPSHGLFTLLPSRWQRQGMCIKAGTRL